MRRRFFLAVALATGVAAIGHIYRVGSQPDPHVPTLDELADGPSVQIIAWPGGGTGVRVSQRLTEPADDVWNVVRDQQRFSEFMPYVQAATPGPIQDGEYELRQVLTLPIGVYRNRLRMRESEQATTRSVRWKQLEGTLTFNEGDWIVETHDDQTVLRYQLSVRVWGVPQWLGNFLMRGRLARIPASIASRIEDLRRRNPGSFSPES